MRDEYRDLLHPWGIEPETVYLRIPRHVALARVRGRTGTHACDVNLSEGVAEEYFDDFEPPTEEGR